MVCIQSADGGTPLIASHGWAFRVGTGAFDPPVYPTTFTIGPTPPVTYPLYKVYAMNWGRRGAIIPDLGASDNSAKITIQGVCCSVQTDTGTSVSPQQYPLSWISGPYGEYWVCPESRCVMRLGQGET